MKGLAVKKGTLFNYLRKYFVYFLIIHLTFAGYIVAVDSVTPTIFILHENGALVKYIECSEYMTEPSDIAIFGSEYYICDFKGHSIVVMHENGNYFLIFILSKNVISVKDSKLIVDKWYFVTKIVLIY